jgi:hypothetical protein
MEGRCRDLISGRLLYLHSHGSTEVNHEKSQPVSLSI